MVIELATSWRAIGSTVCGAAHMRSEKPCQDAIALWQGKQAVALAIADGHGSDRSPHSQIGAQIAVTRSVQVLRGFYQRLTGSVVSRPVLTREAKALPRTLVRTWKRRINEIASEVTADRFVAYGSTLLFALAAPDFMMLGQIGDGDILIVNDEGAVTRPIGRDHRLFANATTSLCTPRSWRDMQIVWRLASEDSLPALILLSTDGYFNSFVSESGYLQVGIDYLLLVREQGIEPVAE